MGEQQGHRRPQQELQAPDVHSEPVERQQPRQDQILGEEHPGAAVIVMMNRRVRKVKKSTSLPKIQLPRGPKLNKNRIKIQLPRGPKLNKNRIKILRLRKQTNLLLQRKHQNQLK